MFCTQCGTEIPSGAKFCGKCGYGAFSEQRAQLGTLRTEYPTTHRYVEKPGAAASQSTNNDASDGQEEFYRAVIGEKSQDFYLRHFQRFDNFGKARISWHWPAFFITFYWFLYRKMWGSAVLYFFLPYIVMIPLAIIGAMAGKSADIAIGVGYLVYLVCIFSLLPMYANALYYKHCRNKIAAAKASSNERQRQLGELSARGGTSNVALLLLIFIPFVVAILAAIALPAYQDYTVRARLAEALSIGSGAAESVANYYYQNQQIPAKLEDAGFVGSPSKSIQGIDINSKNGVVVVTMATTPIVGKSLLLVPSVGADNRIAWKCMSQDIPAKYLPLQCRQ